MRKMLESKMDKLKTELAASIDQKLQTIKDDVMLDISRLEGDISVLKADLEALQWRERLANERGHDKEPIEDTEKTVVIFNLPENSRQNTMEVVEDLFVVLEVPNTCITQVKRLNSRTDKPGLVKVALDSVTYKKTVLGAKQKFNTTSKYKSVWIRTSKTHSERLHQHNLKNVLSSIPGGDKFVITSNGRLVEKNSRPTGDNSQPH